MAGSMDDIPAYHNGSRRAMVETFFAGRLRYEAFPNLAAAREHPNAVAILDSWDERTLAVFPARLIAADEETLDRLLSDLEGVVRRLEREAAEKGRPAHGKVYYEPPGVVSEYMRPADDGVSLDEDLLGLGLEGPVEDVFRGLAPALDPAAVGRIPLMADWWEAVERGDVDAARALLDRGVPADAVDGRGRTALNACARKGDAAMMRLLLDRGADANRADAESGRTALCAAAAEGRVEVVALLLDKGADVDAPARGDGRTPLSLAAEHGHADVVRLLIERGARRGLLDAVILQEVGLVAERLARDGGGRPDAALLEEALEHAARRESVEILRLLLDAAPRAVPAALNGRRLQVLLEIAAESGRLEAARLLVSRGADPHLPDPDGLTPLDRAERAGHAGVARYLATA